jgi:glycosyltransferase involved in cell wall biosynthesis
MRVWLFNPYGPIPGESWRDYSFAMMAQALEEAGHEVIWWTSSFSHHFKKFRCQDWEDRQVSSKTTIRLVPTPGYKRNIGIGRIWRDIVFAFHAFNRGKKEAAPDLIVYSESPLTFGYAGQKLAEFHKVPVIFDQMDLWPELFEQVFPTWFRPIAKLLLSPIYANRRYNYNMLDGVMALAKPYLEAAFAVAPTLRTRPSALVYNGVDVGVFRSEMLQHSESFKILHAKQAGEIWAVFAGSLGPSYDIPAIMEVARMLEGTSSKIRLIVAGDGPYAKQVTQIVADRGNERLLFVGKLAPTVLSGLYSHCDIALCAYSSRSNVEMPDKIYDYTAAGLPIINSLIGEVSSVINDRRIGLQYRAGDSDDLLNALLRLESDTGLRAEMAENSRRSGDLYDNKVQYRKFVALVERVAQTYTHRG